LRRTRTETQAKRLQAANSRNFELVDATALKPGDLVLVEAGDLIPSDGETIEGVASVDESAITGESAPVIRESGGDRSAVTGGTRVTSDWLRVRITAAQGSTFLDRMIALVEGAVRQKTPNEIALNILLAGMTLIFVFATVSIPSFASYAGGAVSVVVLVALFVTLIPTTIGALLSAIGIAGMDRLVRFNVLAMSGRAVATARLLSLSRSLAATKPSLPMRRRSRRFPTKRRRAARSSFWPRKNTGCVRARWRRSMLSSCRFRRRPE
jgi:K+-transporting ATPase ATPase B chain